MKNLKIIRMMGCKMGCKNLWLMDCKMGCKNLWLMDCKKGCKNLWLMDCKNLCSLSPFGAPYSKTLFGGLRPSFVENFC